MRPVAIVNPVAGGGKSRKRWPAIHQLLLDRGLDVEVRVTAGPGDGIRLAREAAAAGAPLVIAVGGDGTVNEVGNGLLQAGAGARLGIIPTGTGRDLARCAGLADARHAVACLAAGQERPLDAGLATWTNGTERRQRYFFLECGTGFVTDVNRSVTAGHRAWKRLGRTLPYVAHTLIKLRGPVNRPFRWSLDGREEEAAAMALTVFNGEYFGGGMHAAPGAALDDGLLDVVGVRAVTRRKLLLLLGLVYRGKHLGRPEVWRESARTVRIDGEGAWFDLDGEVMGPTPVEVSVVPGALTLAQ